MTEKELDSFITRIVVKTANEEMGAIERRIRLLLRDKPEWMPEATWHWMIGLVLMREEERLPTPAPEPPKPWPIEYSAIGAAIDKLDKEGHLERENETPLYAGGHAHYPENREPTLKPEASRPLPAEVEAAVVDCGDEYLIELGDWPVFKAKLLDRLASLWPKGGQVPSVDEMMDWSNGTSYNVSPLWMKRFHKWLLSRMGQPAPLVKGDQPVTAEELAEYLREEMSHWPSPVSTMAYSAWEGLAQGILKAFPSLGQGRLTVSKEQWERLVSRLESRHVILQPAIVFRQWLKDELGAEVEE